MPVTERTETLAELLGAGSGPIRWGRAVAFWGALLISDLMASVLADQLASRIDPRFHGYLSLRLPWDPPDPVMGSLVLAACVVAAFRLVRNQALATLVSAVAYWLFTVGSRWIDQGPVLRISWWDARQILWVFALLFGLSLTVRRVRPFWLALGVGGAAGMLAFQLVEIVRILLISHSWEIPLWAALDAQCVPGGFNLFTAVLLALVFWAGLQATEATKGRLSKAFFVWSLTWGLGLIGSLGVVSLLRLPHSVSGEGTPLLPESIFLVIRVPLLLTVALTFLGMIYISIVMAVVFYRMWAAIQDGHARTSPGRAVGFLFIPLFNLYWAFPAIPGFAREYNRFVERHSLNVGRLPAGLLVTYVILCLAGFVIAIPGLLRIWEFVVVFQYFVTLIMVSQICDAVNALPELRAVAPVQSH